MASRFRLNGERSEDEIQHSIADMLDFCFNGHPVVYSHIPAGGYALTKAAAARLYRLGLKKGLPDLAIFWEGKTLFIELKTPKGSKSAAQKVMHSRLWECGFQVELCRREEDVIAVLKRYGVPHREVSFGAAYSLDKSAAKVAKAQSSQGEAA
jgi:hypothetical protein